MHFKFLSKIYTLLHIFYLFTTIVFLFIEKQHMDPICLFKYIALLYVKDTLSILFEERCILIGILYIFTKILYFFLKISYMQKIFYYDICSSALEMYFFTRNISHILIFFIKDIYTFTYILLIIQTSIFIY